jgi:uncharacterized protein YjbJ (UPF0337 family)
MKSVEGKAKQRVGEGLSDESLAHEGEKLRKEGEKELNKTKNK